MSTDNEAMAVCNDQRRRQATNTCEVTNTSQHAQTTEVIARGQGGHPYFPKHPPHMTPKAPNRRPGQRYYTFRGVGNDKGHIPLLIALDGRSPTVGNALLPPRASLTRGSIMGSAPGHARPPECVTTLTNPAKG